MECIECGAHAVIEQPARCKEHFLAYFEGKVRRVIEVHHLIPPGARIAVAVSGGKDSLTILTLLHDWHGDVTAVAIDEGIHDYRDRTLEDVRRICVERNIPLVIKSFKDLTGKTLDEALREQRLNPCTVCGTLRRHLLNIAAKGFDVLATGHNADDEAQAVLMNVIKGNTELFPRLGPITGQPSAGSERSVASLERGTRAFPRFTPRIKPLYFCTEKEVMTYAYLKGLVRGFTECPHVDESYRRLVRDELNRYAQSHPGVRERILERFLEERKRFPMSSIRLPLCESCGEPSSNSPCKACTIIARLRSEER